MDHNWVKIVHYAQMRIFWQISLKRFLSTYWPLSRYKICKNILAADLEIQICIILDHNRAKIAHLAYWEYFWKYYFYLLIVFYHIAKFEKISYKKSWHISLRNFGPQLDQICLFGPKEDFSRSFTWVIFLCSLCPVMLSTIRF